MADIEILIKMSEEDYNSIEPFLSGKYVCTVRFNLLEVLEIIKNGTPLPKGHGRLIDADALEKLCYEHEIGNSAIAGIPIIAQGQYDDGDDGDNIWKPLFDFAPTIIEADEGE